jgi:5'-3' exonuclease
MVYNIIVNTNSIVLIDCSYYIFYRYFATLRWFKFKNIEFDIQFICENETFIEAFTKHFINDINKICKKWKIKKENIIMCLDCLRNDIWRNDIIDNYKGKRLQSQQFNKNIFDIFKNKINKDIIQISSDRLEADDVAAIIHNKIRSLYKEQKIIIIIKVIIYQKLQVLLKKN